MRAVALIALLVGGLTAGCGKSSEPAPVGDKPAEAASAAEPAAKTTAAAKQISEAEARAHLESWLAAQNSGDFGAYAGLYGEGFKGIKRTGKKTARFDRDGWLADRKRMFERPMKVVAERIVINHNDKGATLQFVQTWTSPTYEDTGPKRMCLIQGADGLVISREEMLESHSTPALDEWAVASAADIEARVSAGVPRDVSVELERLGRDLVLEDESLKALDWAVALTGGLMSFQFSTETTSYLVLARRDGDRFVTVDSDTIVGGSFDLAQRTDVDGDRVRDLVFRWSEKASGQRGIAFVLSKSEGATAIALGESGQGWGVSVSDLCIAELDSGRYLIAALHRWTEAGDKTTYTPLVRVFDIGAGLGETSLHGHAIGAGVTVEAALADAGEATVSGLVDGGEPARSTRVRECRGNPDPMIVMPAATDVVSANIRYQVVRALDEKESDAKRKARALGRRGGRAWSQPPVSR